MFLKCFDFESISNDGNDKVLIGFWYIFYGRKLNRIGGFSDRSLGRNLVTVRWYDFLKIGWFGGDFRKFIFKFFDFNLEIIYILF